MESSSQNSNLVDYLDYYTAIQSPGFAVLVTGAWGVGKTHQIKEALSEKMVYVSLFGLTNTTEIFSAVYVKTFPYKSIVKNIANWFKGTSIKVSGATIASGDLAGLIANTILSEKVDSSKVIVFDDLERCTININDILGCINKYVEFHKCHVIVIAHDSEIEDDISKRKEKIFGQFIKVTPKTNEAYEEFINRCKIPVSVKPIKDIVLTSFIASECQSLRILNHTLNDCVRLFSILNERHKKNEKFLKELFTFFSAISFKIREGEISPKDLENRSEISWLANLKKEETAEPKLKVLQKTYLKNNFPLKITTKTISNDDLIDCIINSIYNKESILNSVDGCDFFKETIMLESWQVIMNFDDIHTHDVDKAIENIFKEIDELSILDHGKIYHAFNLLLMLSRIKHIKESFENIREIAFDYILRLQMANKFPLPRSVIYQFEGVRDNSNGFGYWTHQDYANESEMIRKEIEKNIKIAGKKQRSIFIIELTKLLKENPSKFSNLISFDRGEQGRYFGIDILSSIKPHIFVDLWLSNDVHEWQVVRNGLQSRYNAGHLENTISSEIKWIETVIMNLNHRAGKMSGLDKYRVLRLIPNLTP